MRIVGGRYKGHSIKTPKDANIRPTTDRTRESLFNILAHNGLFEGESARVIDLFAGTGALGLEALSRGAGFALFIEVNARARGLIRENIENLSLTGSSKIFRRDAGQLGEIGTMAPFNIAFLDPPYNKGLGEKALLSLHAGGWLKTGATIILEEDKKSAVTLPEQFQETDDRAYGNTRIIIAQYVS